MKGKFAPIKPELSPSTKIQTSMIFYVCFRGFPESSRSCPQLSPGICPRERSSGTSSAVLNRAAAALPAAGLLAAAGRRALDDFGGTPSF